jgi:hypothetical protein
MCADAQGHQLAKTIYSYFHHFHGRKNVHKEVLVGVNETGMWSTDILEKYVEEILLKRPQTSLL